MNKIYKKMIIALGILIIFTSLNISVLAWDDCPFGYENESYPGTCWRYIDQNNDGICDHSQKEPKEVTQTETNEGNSSSIKQESIRFPILLIVSLIITLILILTLKSLVKSKKISNTKEKIIFNVLLLLFFIPSAITGSLLLIITNMKILIGLGPNLTQLHNISSLFFMWISVYHIIWHTKYYLKSMKNLLK
jgi:hypothetical protein